MLNLFKRKVHDIINLKSKCTRKKATWGHRFLLRSNFGSKIFTSASVFKYVEKPKPFDFFELCLHTENTS